jgi:hypothetical protein
MSHADNSEQAAWEVFWRLRAALRYVQGAEAIAKENKQRWPQMAGELATASQLLASNQGTMEHHLRAKGSVMNRCR